MGDESKDSGVGPAQGPTVLVSKTMTEASVALGKYVAACEASALARRGQFLVALSGGSLPKVVILRDSCTTWLTIHRAAPGARDGFGSVQECSALPALDHCLRGRTLCAP